MRVQKLIGNGLYLKKEGSECQIETDEKRLYLCPACGDGFKTLGNGFYLKREGGLYDNTGLILEPNGPFINIPILGMIL